MTGLFANIFAALPLALQKDATLWMPRQSSTSAPFIDDLFYVIFYICMFFFVGITVGLLIFIYKYHDKEGGNHNPKPSPHHNFALEVVWSIIPMILVVIIFWVGYKGYLDLRTPPAGTYNIIVTGQQWQWLFTYPNGWVDKELHVPSGQPVELTMTSEDVLHSLFIPEFRVKQDVVPGRYTKLWFQSDYPGDYHLFCTEYCGKDHSAMITKCIVHPSGQFEAWLKEAVVVGIDRVIEEQGYAKLGENVYNQFGCKQCHSIDGTVGTGPSFKDLFGHDAKLTDGSSVKVEENYIRESILDPQLKVVAGFDPVMPTFKGKLKDKQITGVIEYLKTLAEH